MTGINGMQQPFSPACGRDEMQLTCGNYKKNTILPKRIRQYRVYV